MKIENSEEAKYVAGTRKQLFLEHIAQNPFGKRFNSVFWLKLNFHLFFV